jgi:RHS repeat-associated protein
VESMKRKSCIRRSRLSLLGGGAPMRSAIFFAIAAAFPLDGATQTITSYQYDLGNNITAVTDPRNLVTSSSFDGLGQRWVLTSPDTGTTSFSYDSYGHLIGMTRADGQLTTYGYDILNRRTSKSAGGSVQTLTYDSCTNGLGRLCSAADAIGTTSYTYSPDGWITGRGFSMGGTTYSIGYSYSPTGNVTSVVYPDGNQALYTYSYGVVSDVQITAGGQTASAASGVTYQPNDTAMAQWTSGNGITNSLTYDTDGRLVGISAAGVQSLGVSYDTANRVIGIVNGMDGAMSQNFGYDAMSRITSVYSNADNEAFQYDANGNRTSHTLNGVAAVLTPDPSSNRIVSTSGSTPASYGYDSNGNLTTVSGTTMFTYDAFGRLSGGGGATYYVGPEGQRLRKVVGGVTTYFAPDSDGPLMAESAAAGWNDYIWLNGRLIGRIVNGQFQAVHVDEVGRPEAVTDASKTVVWQGRNFAFDRQVVLSSSAPLNLGFEGQYFDAETGLWNNGFRDYNPAFGAYLESDPIGLMGGINTYAYVTANPLTYSDPLGLLVNWNGTGQAAAVVDGVGAGGFRFNLTSDCVNGVKVHAIVYAAALGAGLGFKFTGSGSAASFHDYSDTPDADVFNGGFGNAAVTFVTGGGGSFGKTRLGHAWTNVGLTGPVYGADVSAGLFIGASMVESSEIIACGCPTSGG